MVRRQGELNALGLKAGHNPLSLRLMVMLFPPLFPIIAAVAIYLMIGDEIHGRASVTAVTSIKILVPSGVQDLGNILFCTASPHPPAIVVTPAREHLPDAAMDRDRSFGLAAINLFKQTLRQQTNQIRLSDPEPRHSPSKTQKHQHSTPERCGSEIGIQTAKHEPAHQIAASPSTATT